MKSRFSIHVLFFLAFIALFLAFTPNDISILEELKKNPNERSKLLAFLLLYGYFYVCYYVLIPKWVFNKKYILFALVSIGVFVSIIGISKSINWFQKPPMPPQYKEEAPPPPVLGQYEHKPPPPTSAPPKRKRKPSPFGGGDLIQSLLFFLVGIFIAISIRINRKWEDAEQEKLRSELSYLKAQINPHFLFNTLNTLFASALDEKAVKTADALIKLSNMMRYVTHESAQEKVALEKEMEQIQHYIDLQKMRFSETVKVDFSIDGDVKKKSIAPMILINFVENAFKYGISPEEISPIDIKLTVLDNRISFTVFNKKNNKTSLDSTGLGLGNARQLLNTLYPNNHQLTISDTPYDFTVSLLITLI